MSASSQIPLLINSEWLLTNFSRPSIKIMDATFHLPNTARDANAEFNENRIASSLRFDIDDICDKSSELPHTVPSKNFFAKKMQYLGINNDDHIIVYCNSVFLSAARAWWMLRFFGHQKVSVLDGGLKAWISNNGPLESGASTDSRDRGNFTIRPAASAGMIKKQNLLELVKNKKVEQIADARGASRFFGLEPEPRKGVRSGHIPGSFNVPINSLLSESGHLHQSKKLKEAFTAGGIDFTRPVITTCGSGVTACGLAFGLALLNNYEVKVYDGSWSEWGSSDAPIDT